MSNLILSGIIDTFACKIIYTISIFLSFLIRWPHANRNKHNQIAESKKTNQDVWRQYLVFFGLAIIPMVYTLTPWFNFADYTLPTWTNFTGIVVLILAVWLFWQSHHDLGSNWSPSLEIRQEHQLVTNGIYKNIRHPMYTAFWLWAIAQVLLLPNWIAGFSGIVCWSLLYFLRINDEEKMMLEQFGTEYSEYMQQTGRLLPKLFSVKNS
ncbi:protein-S-isoprenylcysteine O-methyltransferase [Fischerella thermalis]|uniref:Protein-S-isoprenylcysteine methyltransferase n=2 Tax=Fischerella TaxID=1190 RepID=A0A2N6LHY7_9CYAN|nr:protein-S-isoprenylcysteine O-methyltransferase [Fischerella thermalis]ACN96026.1 isoprenylcysteine carboxyl methyltransferase [Fischerella sp. MV11]PMB23836.1 protein-S-isoprenylcysteine methyltransferase [Fischerella thermalis CCMEE 5318]